ncbi:MAG: hypothetical protein Q8P67_25810 [archaeon]|nr:hypothetical protein [archaeon]
MQSSILSAVEAMHAYFPSPDSDMFFFKRGLQISTTGSTPESWRPWGSPPLQRIIDILTESSVDEPTAEFLREILRPFAAMQPQEASSSAQEMEEQADSD